MPAKARMPKGANNPLIHQTRLLPGMPAPWFEGTDQFGRAINLHSFRSEKLLLFFYPKNDTPPCTAQVCNLRDNYGALLENGFSVVGVSADNELSSAEFSSRLNVPFSLLADTDRRVIKAYDVWGPKVIAGRMFDGILRTSFIIGADGLIQQVLSQVSTKEHARQILSL